jgi:hypothetical protein
MYVWWGLLSADVCRGDRWRSSFLQMPASLGNCYYISFVIYISLLFTTYMRYLLHSSDAPENCGFVRWVDPPPLHLHQEYIYYLQNRIFDLEREVSSGNNSNGFTWGTSIFQLPLSWEQVASVTTATAACNGWILWRRGNTICYVGRVPGVTCLIYMLYPYICCFI